MQIRSAGPEYIGHRGHGSAPENTMRAFRAGVAAGADRIEFDIQRSADGDYVVMHDSTVDRTTNGKGKVADLTTAELRLLDAGQGEKVPLFREVLDWARANDVALDIEVKHPEPGAEKELAALVREAGVRDPWVMSFDGDFVEKFEKQAPEVTSGVLVAARPLALGAARGAALGAVAGLGGALIAGLSTWPGAGALAAGLLGGAAAGYGLALAGLRRQDLDREVDVHIPSRKVLNRTLVERAQARGKEVAVYTVDDPKQAERMRGWGVDAIISNYADRIRP